MHTLWKNRVDNFLMQTGRAFANFSPQVYKNLALFLLDFTLKNELADFIGFYPFWADF
jgi:hypothetical protein